ncbi:hypothetical protein [Streptomyces vietnamensis]|uniref:hypothetical protein n=1 Tax=Streptomyces vietnamensis TaxID=362257 RepID=UPI003417E649
MTGAPRHGEPYDARRRSLQNVVVGLAGLVVLLAGAALLIGVLPGVVAEERAFLAASECHGARTEDCLRAVSFTVESVNLQRGKGSGGRILVVSTQEGESRLQFNGIGPFLERVRTGDRVTGTIWRGRIVVLADSEGGQRTATHPVGGSLLGATFGIMLLLGGGLGTYAARWWIRHPGHSSHRHPPELVAACRATLGLGIYTFALAVVLYPWEAQLGVFLALWAPAAGPAGVFLFRRRSIGRTTKRRGA